MNNKILWVAYLANLLGILDCYLLSLANLEKGNMHLLAYFTYFHRFHRTISLLCPGGFFSKVGIFQRN